MSQSSSIMACLYSTRSPLLLPRQSRRNWVHQKPNGSRLLLLKASAFNEDMHYYRREGQSVDENMIVLRKRIHEAEMVERNYEPPSNWMSWEKNIYGSYDEMVCEAVGCLQAQLMNTRPCLALGLVVLVGLSVTTTTGLLLFHLLEMAKGLVSFN